jgi:hypothetical protein
LGLFLLNLQPQFGDAVRDAGLDLVLDLVSYVTVNSVESILNDGRDLVQKVTTMPFEAIRDKVCDRSHSCTLS